jgi:hypothetical protein
VGSVITGSAGTLAGLALDSVALAVGTTVAVIWPVETAARVIGRAVHDDGEGASRWVPAGQALRDRRWRSLGPVDVTARARS